ncbi:hypothetical protein D9M68_444610 [compost metagenome]
MPSLPPPTLVSWNTKNAICAKASVTMMKYTPRVRRLSAPTNSAYSAAAPIDSTSSTAKLPPSLPEASTVTYAPMP